MALQTFFPKLDSVGLQVGPGQPAVCRMESREEMNYVAEFA